MQDITQVYKDDEWGWSDYNPMLRSFGYDIVLQQDDNDYQGDSRLLFKDGQRYGYLCFGWGSCSGCDALQACSTLAEVEQLREELHTAIIWFDNAVEAHKWFVEHDWQGDYNYDAEFVKNAKTILKEVAYAKP